MSENNLDLVTVTDTEASSWYNQNVVPDEILQSIYFSLAILVVLTLVITIFYLVICFIERQRGIEIDTPLLGLISILLIATGIVSVVAITTTIIDHFYPKQWLNDEPAVSVEYLDGSGTIEELDAKTDEDDLVTLQGHPDLTLHFVTDRRYRYANQSSETTGVRGPAMDYDKGDEIRFQCAEIDDRANPADCEITTDKDYSRHVTMKLDYAFPQIQNPAARAPQHMQPYTID